MLRESKKERLITMISYAEMAKLEGVSVTSRRILSCGENESIFDLISEGYKDFDEDIKDGEKLGYLRKFGFTFTLPFTLLIGFIMKMGTDIKTLISIASEEANIAALVSNGIIKKEEVPALIERISQLDNFDKILAGHTLSQLDKLDKIDGGKSL